MVSEVGILLLVSEVLVMESRVVMTLQMLSRMVLVLSQMSVLMVSVSVSLSGIRKRSILEG